MESLKLAPKVYPPVQCGLFFFCVKELVNLEVEGYLVDQLKNLLNCIKKMKT